MKRKIKKFIAAVALFAAVTALIPSCAASGFVDAPDKASERKGGETDNSEVAVRVYNMENNGAEEFFAASPTVSVDVQWDGKLDGEVWFAPFQTDVYGMVGKTVLSVLYREKDYNKMKEIAAGKSNVWTLEAEGEGTFTITKLQLRTYEKMGFCILDLDITATGFIPKFGKTYNVSGSVKVGANTYALFPKTKTNGVPKPGGTAENPAFDENTDGLTRLNNKTTVTPISGPQGVSGETFENLFDNKYNTKFCTNYYGDVIFSSDTAVTLKMYGLVTANDSEGTGGRIPARWRLYGGASADGVWTLLDERTSTAIPYVKNYMETAFAISSPASYKYYKIVFEGNPAEHYQFSELLLYK